MPWTVTTDHEGRWEIPGVSTNVPLKIDVVTQDCPVLGTPQPITRATVINVNVPAGLGMQVDTHLEDPFCALRSTGLDYRQYIDYSGGRTLFHVVKATGLNTLNLVNSNASDVSCWERSPLSTQSRRFAHKDAPEMRFATQPQITAYRFPSIRRPQTFALQLHRPRRPKHVRETASHCRVIKLLCFP